MTLRFEATCSPSAEQIAAISRVTPHTPFNTPAYAAACAAVGRAPCLLSLYSGSQAVSGCLAVLQTGRLARSLEIISTPTLAHPEIFWHGVRDFARQRGIWDLSVQSFGSQDADIPRLAHELNRRDRCEYVLDLASDSAFASIATNHKRNIGRARKAGLVLLRTRDTRAVQAHLGVIRASMQRRRDRGEDVSEPNENRFLHALLESGAAELFQASSADQVVSSILIVRSDTSAYYHSAGTSPDGMRLGAAAWLVFEAAASLQREGVRVFNLGGADADAEGLHRFKAGFGARAVALEAATFSFVSPMKRKMRSAARSAIADPKEFLASLSAALFALEHYRVFRAVPAAIAKPDTSAPDDFVMRKLTDQDLLELCSDPSYGEQANRFHRLGFNAAYALYRGGELVHLAWLVDAQLDRRNRIRNVKLRSGEAEITHCFTPEHYRGRGFYPLAIRYLCAIAAADGIRTVYMMTGADNRSSQAGIERAGFAPCGTILRFFSPLAPNWLSVTWRGHRTVFRHGPIGRLIVQAPRRS